MSEPRSALPLWGTLAALFAAGCTIVTEPPHHHPPPPPAARPAAAKPVATTAAATAKPVNRNPAAVLKPRPKATATTTTTAAPTATAAPTTVPMPPTVPTGAWPGTTAESDMLLEINRHRAAGAQCGASNFPNSPPVPMSGSLQLSARTHSRDMAMNGYFDHTGKDGSTANSRAKAAGYTAEVYEAIAGGSAVASEIVDEWMKSDEHCTILMMPNAKAMGVGFVSRPGTDIESYWTVVVGD